MGKMGRDFIPTRQNNAPIFVQPYSIVHDVAKQTGPILRADSDEIRARGGVVVVLQSDGAPTMLRLHHTSLHSRVKSGSCSRCCVSRLLMVSSSASFCASISRLA